MALRGLGILGDVLQRLQTREVDGGLDRLREPADAVGVDGRWNDGLSSLRLERGRQALVGQQRRIDATRKVAQVLERLAGADLQVRRHRCGLAGSRPTTRRAAELHVERDQLLLHAVVDVALELAPLLVLGGDQALP